MAARKGALGLLWILGAGLAVSNALVWVRLSELNASAQAPGAPHRPVAADCRGGDPECGDVPSSDVLSGDIPTDESRGADVRTAQLRVPKGAEKNATPPELAPHMARLQALTHKLLLSVCER
jgi:hypothetical protein